MPSDVVIGDLIGLRDAAMQRLRAATSLMTALKGTSGALGKTSRLLNDYAAQKGDSASPALYGAREAFGTLRLRDEAIEPLVLDLRREVKMLTGLTTALKEALAALQGEAVDVVKLGRAYHALQSANATDPALAALLPTLGQELQ
jgi:hypothetical protein